MALIGGLVVCLLAAPFVEAFISVLPWWLLVPVLFVVIMAVLRSAAGLLFGRAVGDHVMGELVADAIRLVFKGVFWLVALPFRVVLRLLQNA